MKKKNCDSFVDEKVVEELGKTSDTVVEQSKNSSIDESFSYASFGAGLFKKHPILFIIGVLLVIVLAFNLIGSSTLKMTEDIAGVSDFDSYPELEVNNVNASLDSDSLSFSSWTSMSAGSSKSSGGSKNYAASASETISEPMEHATIETGASSETLNAASNKIIYYGDLDIRTANFGATNTLVRTKVNQYGGYIDSYSTSETYSTYKVRIPFENFDAYMSDSEIYSGNDVTSKVSSEDVTIEYADTSSTLESLKIREERLLSYLSAAKNVTEMLTIEEELAEVRGEIQKHQTLLNTMDSYVKYSEINISIRAYGEQVTPTSKLSFWDKLVNTFKEAGEDFVDYTEDFVFGFILGVPTFIFFILRLAIILLIVWGFFAIIKKFINVSRAKKKKKSDVFSKIEDKKEEVISDTKDVE